MEGEPNVRKSHMKYLSYATPRALGPVLRECVQNTTWGHARCRTSGVHTDIWMLTPPRIMWKYGSPVLRTLCGLYTKSHSPLYLRSFYIYMYLLQYYLFMNDDVPLALSFCLCLPL